MLAAVTAEVCKFKTAGVFQGVEKEWGEWEAEELPEFFSRHRG